MIISPQSNHFRMKRSLRTYLNLNHQSELGGGGEPLLKTFIGLSGPSCAIVVFLVVTLSDDCGVKVTAGCFVIILLPCFAAMFHHGQRLKCKTDRRHGPWCWWIVNNKVDDDCLNDEISACLGRATENSLFVSTSYALLIVWPCITNDRSVIVEGKVK